MKKNAMLQIMRVVFCLVIVQFHFGWYDYRFGVPMPSGYLATDYFFILSGCLMMADASRSEAGGESNLGGTRRYIFRKFGKMLPYYLASYVVVFFARLVFRGCSFAKARTLLASSLSELFLVGGSGLYEFYMNGAVWFLSVLFLGSLLLYPVCRKLQRNFSCLLAPLFALFALGYLDAHFHNYSFPRYPYSMVRGLADLCIGCTVFGLFQTGWQAKILEEMGPVAVRRGRIVFSLLEAGLYLAAVLCMHVFQAGDTDYLTILCLAAAVGLSVSGLSYTAEIPAGGKWFTLVSTGTMVLFLSHEYWPDLLGGTFPAAPAKDYFLTLGLMAATAAVVWFVGSAAGRKRGGIITRAAAVLGLCLLIFGMQKLCLWRFGAMYVPLGEENGCWLYYDESGSKMVLLYRERAACDSVSIAFDTAEDPAVLAQLAPEAVLRGQALTYDLPLDGADEDVAFGWKTKEVRIPYLEYTSLRWGVGENGAEARPERELGALPAPTEGPALEINALTDENWTRGILNGDPHQLILEPDIETVVPGQYFCTASGQTVRILSAVLDDSSDIWRLTLDHEVPWDDGGPNQLLPVQNEHSPP